MPTGMGGKLCIHPAQVGPSNEVFRPSADELTWARGVLEASCWPWRLPSASTARWWTRLS